MKASTVEFCTGSDKLKQGGLGRQGLFAKWYKNRQARRSAGRDGLAAATGMNRPSLYAAFGDKHALYVKALEHYWQMGYAAMREALAYDRPLPEALMRVYAEALDIYFPAKGRARGCFAIGTATTE